MKIIVAHSSVTEGSELQVTRETLVGVLAAGGWKVEQLGLPPIGEAADHLPSLASYRLLRLAGACDALLCLDVYSAVLPHPRKFVWLLDGQAAVAAPKSTGTYVANILRAALLEADVLFAPAPVAKRLGKAGWKGVIRFDPPSSKSIAGTATESDASNLGWNALLEAIRP